MEKTTVYAVIQEDLLTHQKAQLLGVFFTFKKAEEYTKFREEITSGLKCYILPQDIDMPNDSLWTHKNKEENNGTQTR